MRKLHIYLTLVVVILAFSGCVASKANVAPSPSLALNASVLVQKEPKPASINKTTLAHIKQNLVRIFYIWEYVDIYGEKVESSTWGSGVLFNRQYVITCYHLGEERPLGKFKVALVFEGRLWFECATVERFNATEDLLLLKLENPVEWKTVRLASKITYGEEIYFGGYTPFPVPRVRMQRLATHKLGIYLHPIFYGDSGGGVFNANGELIGIIYLIYKTDGTFTLVGYAIPLEKLRAFLK